MSPSAIAVVGCVHGELDTVYAACQAAEAEHGVEIGLVLLTGDIQAVRAPGDLETMAVPLKYRVMGDFWKYASGAAVAPYLTLCIAGNHEASSHMHQLPAGGWIAPNIWYMGRAGVVWWRGLRIGAWSGIYDHRDFHKPHDPAPAWTRESAVRSVYHTRAVDGWRLAGLTPAVDIFMSHDWPGGIAHAGDVQSLIAQKPLFEADIASGKLGSPPAAQLLQTLKPARWFASHLHIKWSACVHHMLDARAEAAGSAKATQFLALDKAVTGRAFLQLLPAPAAAAGWSLPDSAIAYDAEWLAILRATAGSEPSPQSGLPVVDCEQVRSAAAAAAAAATGDAEGTVEAPELPAAPTDGQCTAAWLRALAERCPVSSAHPCALPDMPAYTPAEPGFQGNLDAKQRQHLPAWGYPDERVPPPTALPIHLPPGIPATLVEPACSTS